MNLSIDLTSERTRVSRTERGGGGGQRVCPGFHSSNTASTGDAAIPAKGNASAGVS